MLFQPTAAQRRIIEAPTGARLIVDAGPGTGKTATAAARVLHLLAAGVSPDRLWMVSFARAAVAEMRSRLLAFGGEVDSLPRVTTLDSLAWRLRGQDLDGEVLDGYDSAIAETLAALRGGDALMLARLKTVDHILFDETQDMVGHRAALAAEIVDRLRTAAGVTLLTDEAQAIYGFSAGSTTHSLDGETLAQHFLSAQPDLWKLHELVEIHRTHRTRLVRLFARTRIEVLRPRDNPQRKLAAVRQAVQRNAKPFFGAAQPVPDGPDTLILYRSRAEVLAEAGVRFSKGMPFRLRMSGLPPVLCPWLALVFDNGSSSMGKAEFLGRWTEYAGANDGTEAWETLHALAGEGSRVQAARLRRLLSSNQPPPELCVADPGDPLGPVIGTIHASKGREMDNVRLMMPQGSTGRDDPEAEARVLFVGATRARLKLELSRGGSVPSKKLPSGRALMRIPSGPAAIEVGRPGDFDFQFAAPGYREAVNELACGAALTMVDEGGRLSLRRDGTVLALASTSFMQDMRAAQRYFRPDLDFQPVRMSLGPVCCLAVSASVPKESRKIVTVPVAAGISTIDFYKI